MNAPREHRISPETAVTLEELVRLAHGLECRAAEKYAALAAEMRAHGNDDAADVFDWLAAEEASHIDAVEALSEGITVVPDGPVVKPAAYEDESAEPGMQDTGPYLVTPYEAFDRAVASERRAFDFFSGIAAQAGDPDVREFAERLAKEELRHLAICRLERRRAFRAQERESGIADALALAASVDELSASRREIERALVRAYRAAAHTAARNGDRRTEDSLQHLARSIGGSDAPAPETAHREADSTGESTFAAVRLALRETERAFRYFDTVTDETDDEDVLFAAQGASAALIAPMRELRQALDHLRLNKAVAE